MHAFLLFNDLPSDDASWVRWREMVDEQGWFNKDRSVMETMPLLETTKSVVAKDSNGETVCHLMWSEYDGLSYIHTFVTDESQRGQGIGKKVWKQAMARIDSENTVVMLKSVESMIPFYKTWNLTIEDSRSWVYAAECKIFLEIFTEIGLKCGSCVKVENASESQLDELIQFDSSITGHNRSTFLKRYHSLDYTQAFCTRDEHGSINGIACITPTSGTKEKNLYKLAPVYTSHQANAVQLIVEALRNLQSLNENARIIFVLIENTRGFKEFDSILSEKPNVLKRFSSVLLTSRALNNPIDRNRLFIANNNDCHFDA